MEVVFTVIGFFAIC